MNQSWYDHLAVWIAEKLAIPPDRVTFSDPRPGESEKEWAERQVQKLQARLEQEKEALGVYTDTQSDVRKGGA